MSDVEAYEWKTIAYIGAVRRELDAIDEVKLCEEFPTLSSKDERRAAWDKLRLCRETTERLDRELEQMDKED